MPFLFIVDPGRGNDGLMERKVYYAYLSKIYTCHIGTLLGY